MKTRALMAALSVLALTGCSHTPRSHNASPDFSFAERSDVGLVVFSGRLSNDCEHGEAPEAIISVHEAFGRHEYIGNIRLEPDSGGSESQPRVHFISRELRPGSYKLKKLTFMYLKQADAPLDIPFEVEAGKAIYLGELHANLLGCSGFSSFNIQINDAWERDRQLLQGELKNVRLEEVEKTLAQCPTQVACRGPTP